MDGTMRPAHRKWRKSCSKQSVAKHVIRFRGAGGRGRGRFGRGGPAPAPDFPAAQAAPIEANEVPQGSVNSSGGKKPSFIKEAKQKTGPPNLARKAQSTINSAEKNDPMISDVILIDGLAGFVERTRNRTFELDLSAYPSLVRASYDAQVTFDRGFKKYVSFGMYLYYCTVLLWRRIWYVVSQRGRLALEYDRLTRYLNFDMPEPQDIAMFLSGIGDITDFSDRKFQFHFRQVLTNLVVYGSQGSYGIIGPGNIVEYETLPSLAIAIGKMINDLDYTINEADPEWDLPEGLRPEDEDALLPNANLLGWSRSERLTQEQQTAYEDAGITSVASGCTNVSHLPINQMLMRYVAGMLENSKCKATTQMTTATSGSLCQVPLSVRGDDAAIIDVNRSIAQKDATTVCYGQASSHIAGGSATFRYRIHRRTNEMDSVGYRFAGEPPAGWLVHENDVFNAGAVDLWNLDQYRIASQNGIGLHTMIATRVRRKVSKE